MFKLRISGQVGAIVLPVTLICFLVYLSFTKFFFSHHHELSTAIAVDLVFSIPIIHLLLFKRNSNVKYSTGLFFTGGILLASVIIPKSDQYFLHQIRFWVVPVVEFCSIGFCIFKAQKALANYKKLESSGRDFYTVFKEVTKEILPKRLALIVSAEISAFYYVFFSWRKPVLNSR
jgi:hypothetical protein